MDVKSAKKSATVDKQQNESSDLKNSNRTGTGIYRYILNNIKKKYLYQNQ